jgi:hypothetical protein
MIHPLVPIHILKRFLKVTARRERLYMLKVCPQGPVVTAASTNIV